MVNLRQKSKEGDREFTIVGKIKPELPHNSKMLVVLDGDPLKKVVKKFRGYHYFHHRPSSPEPGQQQLRYRPCPWILTTFGPEPAGKWPLRNTPPAHRRGGSATAAPPKSRDISTGWGQRMAPPKASPASWLPFLIYRWPWPRTHSYNAVLALALGGRGGTWFLAPHS